MNPSSQKRFRKQVSSLLLAIEEMGNLFLDDTEKLYATDTKNVASDVVEKTLATIEQAQKRPVSNFSGMADGSNQTGNCLNVK